MKTKPRSSKFITALGTALIVGVFAWPSFADDKPSRDYPPTYSSRRKPWYDISDWFTSSSADEKPVRQSEPKRPEVPPPPLPPIPPPMVTVQTSPPPKLPVPPAPAPVFNAPPTESPTNGPAWKWYGYGAPVPNGNALAPNGRYEAVPLSWHQVVGSTPGAVPMAQLRGPAQPYLAETRPLVPLPPSPPVLPIPTMLPPVVPPTTPVTNPAPVPLVTPNKPNARKPILPEGGSPYSLVKVPNEVIDVAPPKIGPLAPIVTLPPPLATDSVNWKPAKLATPIPEEPAAPPVSEGPRATLKPPVADDRATTPSVTPTPTIPPATDRTPIPTESATPTPMAPVRIAPPPGFALPSVNPGTPDIPINPANGIRVPD